MNKSLIVVLPFFVTASLVPHFSQGVAEAREKSALVALHKASLTAHLMHEIKFFSEHQADPATMVGRGKVGSSTRAETDARFSSYFRATTFTRYEDLIEPIVSISKDGSMAWVAVQVAVEGEQKSDDGRIEKFKHVWAWISISEKRNGKWLLTANSSSLQP